MLVQRKGNATLRSVEAEPLEVRVQEVCVDKALGGLVSLCLHVLLLVLLLLLLLSFLDSPDCFRPPRIMYSVTASVSQKRPAGLVPLGGIGIAPRDAPDLSGSTGLFYNIQSA
jgi:hypothetical protein